MKNKINIISDLLTSTCAGWWGSVIFARWSGCSWTRRRRMTKSLSLRQLQLEHLTPLERIELKKIFLPWMWICYLQARVWLCLVGVLPARYLGASSPPWTCCIFLHKCSNQREAWTGGGAFQGFWLCLPLLLLVLVQPVLCVFGSIQIFTFGLRSSSSVLPC